MQEDIVQRHRDVWDAYVDPDTPIWCKSDIFDEMMRLEDLMTLEQYSEIVQITPGYDEHRKRFVHLFFAILDLDLREPWTGSQEYSS